MSNLSLKNNMKNIFLQEDKREKIRTRGKIHIEPGFFSNFEFMSPRHATTLLLIILCASCSDKYMSYKDQYQFKSKDGAPDYSNLDYWAAHPWKWDPSDSIPEFLKTEIRDT